MTALAKIKDAGFTLSLTDSGNLKIAPFSKLTPEQRDYLKKQKQEIIEQLKAETEAQAEAVITIYPRFVTCYTPNGKGLKVMAKDAEHEAFLLRMNPPQCGNCQNFTPHHAHGKATGTCKAGVMPSGVCHWSETQHTCNQFAPKEQPSC
jgi:hypothetical protein